MADDDTEHDTGIDGDTDAAAATARWLDDVEMSFWRAFLEVNLGVLDAISHDLKDESDLTTDDYEVLVRLSEAPERRVRMSELSDQVVQSRSRLSQRIDRMVQRGWVRRERCPDDGRGALAVLTDAGFDVLAEAAPGHVASVRRHLIDRLDRSQLAAGCEMFEQLLARTPQTEPDAAVTASSSR